MTDAKQQKREARQIKERAEAAMVAGDYRLARQLDLQVSAMAPDTDLGGQALAEAQNLRTDPWTLYGGLGALALYIFAWLYAAW